MELSPEYKQVIGAIHSVQQIMDVIQRAETADTGKYSYRYASLAAIWVKLKPQLKKYELTIMQPVIFNVGDTLETWIFHSSGEWAKSRMRLVITRDDPQGMGSAITYARRYGVVSAFGLVTDDDNDATTQRLADGDMKKEWVRAYTIVSKKAAPDHAVTGNEFIKFMADVYGKHPTKVLASEHQQVLDTINAFDSTTQE